MNTFILVPTDFTEAADNALKHAVVSAEKTGAKIQLVHVCKESAQLLDAKIKLKSQAATIKPGVQIDQIVRVGDLGDLPQIAKELSSGVIFLGTHGAKGVQKIMGSNTLKLVTNSNVPFIIVQKGSPAPTEIKRILVPTSFHFESKQKITAVSAIAKYFNSVVYFVYKEEKDTALKDKNLNNLKFMKMHLDKEGIKYNVKAIKDGNFNNETLKIAKELEVDLIAIMNMQKNSILGTGLLGANYEQELVMNEQKIPVMIISPRNGMLILEKTSFNTSEFRDA